MVGCGVEVGLPGAEQGGGGEEMELAAPRPEDTLSAPACDGPGCCPEDLRPILYTAGADLVPQAEAMRCHVTFAGADAVTLQVGPEGEGGAVVAGPGADLVVGCGGDDVLRGGLGPDALWGDGGDDQLLGERGADALHGGGGDDGLDGGPGPDALHGGPGADVLSGGPGWDALFGGAGADDIDGGPGADLLHGDGGADVLRPGPGVDVVFAGGGDDRVEVYASCELAPGEVLAGGPGTDVLVLPVPLADAEAMGVWVVGFEEVLVEPHPCRSLCAGARAGAVPCSPGACEETGGESYACSCPPGVSGPECDACAEGYAGALCDRCAAGYHAALPLEAGEAPQPPGADFDGTEPPAGVAAPTVPTVCVPDETCDPNQGGPECGLGSCVLEDGVAGCVCPPHRTGVDQDGVICGRCVPGYEPDPNDPSGPCVLGDACAEARCGGRGSCVAAPAGSSGATTPTCACDPGYAGDACQVCAAGYHGVADEAGGVRCEPDETCTPDTCGGHGACAVEGGVATCACDPGYFGDACGQTCIDNTCNGAGTCVELPEGPTCQCVEPGLDPDTECATCRPGFDPVPGDGCALQDGCDAPDACAGHGTCTASGGVGHTCACEPGYAGPTCDACDAGYLRLGEVCVPAATCDEDGCGGAGSCEVAGGTATCACDDGFYGARCQLTNPPTRITVSGQEQALAPGESTTLQATLEGIADFEQDLVWSVVEGGGTIAPGPDGTAVYTASPATGTEVPGQATVIVAPACCDEAPPVPVDLPFANRGKWIQWQRAPGPFNAAFAAFDRAILDYMWDRCIGAMAVAVQRDGTQVYAAGYGRTRGAPTDGPNALWDTRCHDAFDPSAEPMHPSNPLRIGSNSKFMVAAMVRWAVRQTWPSATDEEIEAIRLCEDHPVVGTLLPDGVRDVLCGLEPLPVDVFADTTPPSSCGQCYNGAACNVQQVNGKSVFTCTCAPGYFGQTCSLPIPWSVEPPYFADTRWQQVTLGHLMTHTSGHPGTAPQSDTLRRLAQLRGYEDAADLAAAEQAADGVNPSPLVALHGPLQSLRGVDGDPEREAYFVAQPDLDELYTVTPYRALRRDPGLKSQYVNGNFSIQHLVVEHLSGLPLAPRYDLPGVTWEGSALGAFLAESEGIDGGVRSARGILPSPVVLAQREPNEPYYRYWSGGQMDGTWSPRLGDKKQPDCIHEAAGLVCDPGPWLAEDGADSTRYGWGEAFAGPVHVAYTGTGIAPGQGSMAVELPLWLRLMGRYAVSGGAGGAYARPRYVDATLGHSGLVPRSAASYEAQFGTDDLQVAVGDPCVLGQPCTVAGKGSGTCLEVQGAEGLPLGPRCVWGEAKKNLPRTYPIPPPDPATGKIPIGVSDAGLVRFTCPFPDGVDLIVAVPQVQDPASEANKPDGDPTTPDLAKPYGTGREVGRLRGYALHALCSVDWQEVQP